MTIIFDDPKQEAELRQWVEAIGKGPIDQLQRISGGGYRISSRVELGGPSKKTLFLKTDTGSAPKVPFNLKREYEFLAALDGRVRAPKTLGYHDACATMAMECLNGEADYRTIPDADRPAIEKELISALADVHALDVSTLGLAHMPPGQSISEAIRTDIDLWQKLLLDNVAEPHPIALLSLAWVRARMPEDNRPAVLVQGDAGPGNFLYQGERITGLVDWEVAHLGHPLEDLGCILARSLVQPFASADRLLNLYREATGENWTKSELIYSTILVMARFAVPISMSLVARDPRIDYALTTGYFHASMIAMLQLIAAAEGFTLDTKAPTSGTVPPLGFEFEYLDYLLNKIVAPAIEDPYILYRLQGGIGLIGYLASHAKSLPHHSSTPAIATMADADSLLKQDSSALQKTMQALMHDALYTEELMHDLLGPLHGRRLSL